MGCDIHVYREKRINGEWLTADKWKSYDYGDDDKGETIPWKERAYSGRNYSLFGLLSRGVREDHEFALEQRGMPLVCSAEVRRAAEGYGEDGHSHSYLYLFELIELRDFLKKDATELQKLRESIDTGAPDWNLLYPYCKWASSPSYEDFALQVPADFMVGECVQKLIDSFTGIDGDMHRLVFFFDN